MTAAEKAAETRAKHREARKAKIQEQKEIRKKMIDVCLHVLDDQEASPGQKIKAIEILRDLQEGR